MAIVRSDYQGSLKSSVVTLEATDVALNTSLALWKTQYPLIVNALAFRFRHNGIFSNPVLANLDSQASLTALYKIMFDVGDESGVIAYASNDLSIPAGVLLSVTFGGKVTNNFTATFHSVIETLTLSQLKKRQWGLYIKLRRRAKTRSAAKNRLYIRVPHK